MDHFVLEISSCVPYFFPSASASASAPTPAPATGRTNTYPLCVASHCILSEFAVAPSEGQLAFFSPHSCLLCDELNGEKALSARLGLYASAQQKVLLQSRNFVLIPDISPLVPGHTLIVSKHHVSCYAALEAELAEEFEAFKDQVVAHYESRLRRPALFEHGSLASVVRSGACVQHAHVHVLPLVLPLSSWSKAHGVVRHCANPFSRAGILGTIPEDYLAFESAQGTGGVVTGLRSTLPCQFLRRQVARHLDLQHWDWAQVLLEPPVACRLIPPELERP